MAEKTIAYFLGVMPLEKNGEHGVEEAHSDEGKAKADVDGAVSVERPTVKPSCSFCHGRGGHCNVTIFRSYKNFKERDNVHKNEVFFAETALQQLH